jgi:hypothetical protein
VHDNCNYDGYANSRYTIAITAFDNMGTQPYYAEPCAAVPLSLSLSKCVFMRCWPSVWLTVTAQTIAAAPSSGGTASIITAAVQVLPDVL